jgi:glutamate N-acetyltransferase/amino-acid N-acetyltransferase
MNDNEAISPLAPAAFPDLEAVPGVKLASVAAGLRYQKRADLMLAVMEEGTTVAGTLTQSRCASAPVDWCRRVLPKGRARALVCNAGNANAFTGRAGETATEATASKVAELLDIDRDTIYLASTGVIGETLPTEALTDALPRMADSLSDPTPEAWLGAANAIRTTDTFAKGASAVAHIGDVAVHVSAIAKGSGMIAPDMATMLSFAFTDAKLPADVLREVLLDAVGASFNSITVDSDTSTSDTVLLFATGRADAHPAITRADDPALEDFRRALGNVLLDLAQQIVRDGEGATKFVTVEVEGAESDASARVIALAIGNSPLVKTMLAAEDANWGRIVMAVGKAGEPADRDKLDIWIGEEQAASGGQMRAGYSEERATAFLQRDEVLLRANVGVGEGSAKIWTCDLTHGYIDINAGYRS